MKFFIRKFVKLSNTWIIFFCCTTASISPAFLNNFASSPNKKPFNSSVITKLPPPFHSFHTALYLKSKQKNSTEWIKIDHYFSIQWRKNNNNQENSCVVSMFFVFFNYYYFIFIIIWSAIFSLLWVMPVIWTIQVIHPFFFLVLKL